MACTAYAFYGWIYEVMYLARWRINIGEAKKKKRKYTENHVHEQHEHEHMRRMNEWIFIAHCDRMASAGQQNIYRTHVCVMMNVDDDTWEMHSFIYVEISFCDKNDFELLANVMVYVRSNINLDYYYYYSYYYYDGRHHMRECHEYPYLGTTTQYRER